MRRAPFLSGVFLAFWGTAAFALDVPQDAKLTAERKSSLDSYTVPYGSFAEGRVPIKIVEGEVTRRAYRMERQSVTSLQLLAPLREQLEAEGYDVLFECDQTACGGFDFRFAIEVMPAPNMSVSLRDYRFLTAVLGDDAAPQKIVTVIVSRTSAASYLQVVEVDVRRSVDSATPTAFIPEVEEPQIIGDLSAELLRVGHVVLSDLVFETGSSTLGEGTYASLNDLAKFMMDNPTARVALVGHTDTEGALQGNISLSRKRAESVLDALRRVHDIPASRLEAGGMGYLSPLRSNLTEAGREANRRVEAVLLEME